jgi:hypothetical protein
MRRQVDMSGMAVGEVVPLIEDPGRASTPGLWLKGAYLRLDAPEPDVKVADDTLGRIARRREPDGRHESAELIAILQVMLSAYLESRQSPAPDALLTRGHGDDTHLYRPTLDEGEFRVLELFSGAFESPLEGALHHVNGSFEYSPIVGDAATLTPWTDFVLAGDEPLRFTALSYCWGTSSTKRVITVNSHDKEITETLDTALRHLRHATEPVMLWIDQICINQEDLADKQSQVKLMALIYRRAWSTIIWLSDDAELGAFRALQGLHEACQFRNNDLLDSEMEYLRHPLHEEPEAFDSLRRMLGQPWFHRTW